MQEINASPIVEYENQVELSEFVQYVDLQANYDNEALINRLLNEAGVEFVEIDLENIDSQRLLTDDNYATNVLFQKIIKHFTGHGELVTSSSEASLQRVGSPSSTVKDSEISPVQDALSHFRFFRDGLGNPVIEVQVRADVISEQIQASQQSIVNLSLQVGTLRATYEVRQEIPLYKVNSFLTQEGTVSYYSQHHNIEYQANYDSVDAGTVNLETLRVIYERIRVEQPADDQERESLLMRLREWDSDDLAFLLERGAVSEDEYTQHDGRIFNQYVQTIAPTSPDFTELEVTKIEGGNFQIKERVSVSITEALQQGLVLSEELYAGLSNEERVFLEEKDNPVFHISDALNPERARESLLAMYQLAEENSDKLIFTAAGNNDSYFAQEMAHLAEEGKIKPINLIFVGVYFGENSTPSDGGTLYVHYREEMLSSSEATGFISGIAANLARKGLGSLEITYLLLTEFSREQSLYSPSQDTEIQIQVTRPDLISRVARLIVVETLSKDSRFTYHLAENELTN